MKKYFTYLTLIFLLFNSYSLKAQEDSSASNISTKELEKMTLAEAKSFLQKESAGIEAISQIGGIKFSFEPGKSSQKEAYEKPYVFQDESAVNKAFATYFKSLTIFQQFNFPHSVLHLRRDWEAAKLVEGYEPAKYRDAELFYNHGQSRKLGELSNDQWSFEQAVPVDSIRAKAIYDRPSGLTKIKLNKEHIKESWNGGFAELTSLKGNEVSLLLSDTVYKNLLKVEALNAAGKSLSQSTYNSSSAPSAEMIGTLEKYNQLFKSVASAIDAGKYAGIENVIADLKLKAKGLPKIVSKNVTHASYVFKGNVVSLSIYVKSGNRTEEQWVVLKPQKATAEFTVAKDSVSDKYGLLQPDGKWVAKPVYERLRLTTGAFYNGEENGKDFDYWFDHDKKELVQLPFVYRDSINDTYAQVQKGDNGSLGIVNTKTGKLVLPLKYGYLNVKGQLVALREGENTYSNGLYGGYNLEGKEVLPLKYKMVSTDGSYFYTDRGTLESSKGKELIMRERKDVFNRLGKQLNPPGTSVIGTFEGEQPLLLKTAAEKFFFIDSLGKKVIDAVTYDFAAPFSNGMATVIKKGKRGAINRSGQLIIPLVYEEVHPFQKNYALAEKRVNGVSVYTLIDKNNKVVKSFKGSYTSISVPLNSNEGEYFFSGGTGKVRRYNADGKDVTDQKEE